MGNRDQTPEIPTLLPGDHTDPDETRRIDPSSEDSGEHTISAPIPERPATTVGEGPEQGDGHDRLATSNKRFKIRGRLGSGGMGVVLDADDLVMHREVAIKVLARKQNQPPSVARFVEEAQIQGQLEHPGICPIHDLGFHEDGRPWFAMKKVRGESLSQILKREADRRGNDLPARHRKLMELLDIFARVCDTVAFAHSRSVVHRDLKPANVMVGAFGEVHVMDWGLARVLHTAESQLHEDDPLVVTVRSDNPALASMAGAVMGTPAYMAPEQARGKRDDVSECSDIYSLGAVLYHILTLTPPHWATTSNEVLRLVKEGDIAWPSRRAPHLSIPSELESIVMKALERSPADRYSSVGELLSDIRAFREGRLVTAARYSPWLRAKKWALRHRALSLVTAACLITALLLGSAAYWQRVSDENERTTQERNRWELAQKAAASQLQERLAQVARVTGDSAPALKEPNGEPVVSAVEDWFQAHAFALESLDTLRQLDESRPGSIAESVSPPSLSLYEWNGKLAKEAAILAARQGDASFARSWVRRAWTAEGVLLAEVEAELSHQQKEQISAVETQLSKLRDPKSLTAEIVDGTAVAIVRHRSPSVVRYLLEKERIESTFEFERRVVITALGRLGDTRTQRADGLDPVTALVERLNTLSLDTHLNECVAIANALGLLADERATEALFNKRWATGMSSVFWDRTQTSMERLPLPKDFATKHKSSDEFVSKGLRLGSVGDHEGEIAAYTQSLKLNPKNVDALVNRGVAYLQTQQYQKSIADHTEAIRLDPKNPNPHFNRGNTRVSQEQWDAAIADYLSATKLDPKMAVAYAGWGRALEGLGKMEDALAKYGKSLELNPKSPITLSSRGVTYYRMRRLPEALRDFDASIALRPNRSLPHMNRGIVLSNMGKLDEAVTAYGNALKYDPKSVLAYNNRALLYHRRGHYKLALADYAQANHISPDHPVILANRSRTHAAMGRSDLAVKDLDASIAKSPKNAGRYDQRAKLRWQMKDLKGCLADFSKAIELAPDFANYWFNRSQIQQALGHHAEAVEDLEKAAELNKEGADVWLRMARLRADLGRHKPALEASAKACEREPGLVIAWDLKAKLELDFGTPALAVDAARRALALTPKSADAHFLLARAVARRAELHSDEAKRRDDIVEARKSLRRAKELGRSPLNHQDLRVLRQRE